MIPDTPKMQLNLDRCRDGVTVPFGPCSSIAFLFAPEQTDGMTGVYGAPHGLHGMIMTENGPQKL